MRTDGTMRARRQENKWYDRLAPQHRPPPTPVRAWPQGLGDQTVEETCTDSATTTTTMGATKHAGALVNVPILDHL
jgi:hypothetical protein